MYLAVASLCNSISAPTRTVASSQPVPQWVMAPELKLGALLDDTLVALRNRARELPELPKGSVFPEDDAVDLVTVAEAAAVVASPAGGSAAKSSSNAAPQTTVKNNSTPPTGDRHTKKSDAANGGRKDRARADKRGYVPSRSKRSGGGAYGWGAAPTAAELVKWEVRVCAARILEVFREYHQHMISSGMSAKPSN